MWIHPKDKVKYKNKVLTVINIDGIYSVASNITITLQDEQGKKIKMNYMSEFYPKYQANDITDVYIHKKPHQGF